MITIHSLYKHFQTFLQSLEARIQLPAFQCFQTRQIKRNHSQQAAKPFILDALVNLLSGVVLAINLDSLQSCLFLGLHLGSLLVKNLLDVFIDQLVGTHALSVLGVLNHEVCKLVNMATSLEHIVWSDATASKLKHILLQDEVVPPELLHIRLECGSEWTIIIKSGDTAIDIERLSEKEFTLEEILTLLPPVLILGFLGLNFLILLLHNTLFLCLNVLMQIYLIFRNK